MTVQDYEITSAIAYLKQELERAGELGARNDDGVNDVLARWVEGTSEARRFVSIAIEEWKMRDAAARWEHAEQRLAELRGITE